MKELRHEVIANPKHPMWKEPVRIIRSAPGFLIYEDWKRWIVRLYYVGGGVWKMHRAREGSARNVKMMEACDKQTLRDNKRPLPIQRSLYPASASTQIGQSGFIWHNAKTGALSAYGIELPYKSTYCPNESEALELAKQHGVNVDIDLVFNAKGTLTRSGHCIRRDFRGDDADYIETEEAIFDSLEKALYFHNLKDLLKANKEYDVIRMMPGHFVIRSKTAAYQLVHFKKGQWLARYAQFQTDVYKRILYGSKPFVPSWITERVRSNTVTLQDQMSNDFILPGTICTTGRRVRVSASVWMCHASTGDGYVFVNGKPHFFDSHKQATEFAREQKDIPASVGRVQTDGVPVIVGYWQPKPVDDAEYLEIPEPEPEPAPVPRTRLDDLCEHISPSFDPRLGFDCSIRQWSDMPRPVITPNLKPVFDADLCWEIDQYLPDDVMLGGEDYQTDAAMQRLQAMMAELVYAKHPITRWV